MTVTFKILDEKWKKIPPARYHEVKDLRAFNVTAHAGGQEIGHAEVYNADGKMMVSDVMVVPSWRRQGIATKMYLLIEKITGKKLAPYGHQYDDGKAFWGQPNRPFGRSEGMSFLQRVGAKYRLPGGLDQ